MKKTRISKSKTQIASYDFRLFLHERFKASQRRNPNFSLRSFARQLRIDNSSLSQILRGKRSLSVATIRSAGRRLGLPEEAIDNYIRAQKELPELLRSDQQIQQIQFDLDTFQLISVWYHQAILELTHIRGFRSDSRWIAKTLGITVDEVNIALQRLLRLGLLEMSQKDRWRDKSGDAEFHGPPLPEASSKLVEAEIHELAISAIENVSASNRAEGHMIFAVDRKKLAELKRLLDRFLGEVSVLVSKENAPDDVYYAEVSIFPLTRFERGEK